MEEESILAQRVRGLNFLVNVSSYEPVTALKTFACHRSKRQKS